MATAIGCWTPPMLVAVKVVGAVVPAGGNSRPRLSSEIVLDPLFVTIATPRPSSIATPVGLVPVATAGTFAAGVVKVRSIIEAVPSPLLATTAKPKRWLMAIPWGVVPTLTGFDTAPKAGFGVTTPLTVMVGFTSITEILLQPLSVTTAIGENGPLASWSAMATADGCTLPP